MRNAFQDPYENTPHNDTDTWVTPEGGHLGGYGDRYKWTVGPDGQSHRQTVATNLEDIEGRYRGMGDAYAKRKAYQLDFDQYDRDRALGGESRNGQLDAARMLRAQAVGDGPSQAQALSPLALDQTMRGQMQQQAQTKGFAATQAAAMNQGQMQQAQLADTDRLAAMRAHELQSGQQAYTGATGQIRSGDYNQMELDQRRAKAQMEAELYQRQLNQRGQQNFEQLGFNAENQEMNAGTAMRRIQDQYKAAQARARQDSIDRDTKMGAGAFNAFTMGMASVKGGDESSSDKKDNGKAQRDADTASSDERTKTNISTRLEDLQTRFGDNAAEAVHAVTSRISGRGDVQLDQHHGGGMAASAARRYTTMSDDRTKLAAAEASAYALGRAHGDEAIRSGKPVPFAHAMPTSDIQDMSAAQVRANQAARSTQRAAHSRSPEERAALMAERAPQPTPSSRLHDEAGFVDEELRGIATHPLTYARNYTKPRAEMRAAMAQADGESDPMGSALASGLKPKVYEYKPKYASAEGQRPGEKNVGPMAQDMASNNITGSAVVKQPDGMLGIDVKKGTKLSLAAAGYLAQKQQEQEERLRRLEGGGR